MNLVEKEMEEHHMSFKILKLFIFQKLEQILLQFLIMMQRDILVNAHY